MTTAHRPSAENRDAMDAAYDLGIARQRLADMERRMAPRPLRKQLMDLVWLALIGAFVLGVFWWGEYRGLTAASAQGGQPMPTAAIPTRSAPTSPPPFSGGQGSSAPPPAPDYGQAAYNAAQEERATTLAAGEPATEAEIQEWLSAPVSTPTPLPEPDEPGFAESFQAAPECSPFIGYLAGDPCVEILKQQAGE